MAGRRRNVALSLLFLMACSTGPVLAQEEAHADANELDRLRALLDAQQARLATLEQQLTAQQHPDVERMRIDEMRKQIREILSETEFRESLMPSTVQAGYDKGFYIRSTDDKFLLKISGMMQFRYTYYGTHRDNRYLAPGLNRSRSRSGFDMQRTRLRLAGHVYSKDLTYLLEFDMNPSTSYDTRLFYAYVNYRIADEFQIRAGQFRMASTRADYASTATMQFVDYPMMNAVFGLGNGLGVQLWGRLLEGRGEYYLQVVNALSNAGRATITTDETRATAGHDNNPAIVFRTVWQLLQGSCMHPDDADHFTAPCDLGYHTSPALNMGFHYAFAEDYDTGHLRIPFPQRSFFRRGGFGLTNSKGLQIHQFGTDIGFKYRGFSLMGEYVMRLLDVRAGDSAPFAPLYQLTGDGSTNAQHGGYLQAGYLLPLEGALARKIEIVGRVGGLAAVSGGSEGTWDYGAGINYYIKGHKVKLQADVTKIYEAPTTASSYSLANVNDDALIWRIQLQVAF